MIGIIIVSTLVTAYVMILVISIKNEAYHLNNTHNVLLVNMKMTTQWTLLVVYVPFPLMWF